MHKSSLRIPGANSHRHSLSSGSAGHPWLQNVSQILSLPSSDQQLPVTHSSHGEQQEYRRTFGNTGHGLSSPLLRINALSLPCTFCPFHPHSCSVKASPMANPNTSRARTWILPIVGGGTAPSPDDRPWVYSDTVKKRRIGRDSLVISCAPFVHRHSQTVHWWLEDTQSLTTSWPWNMLLFLPRMFSSFLFPIWMWNIFQASSNFDLLCKVFLDHFRLQWFSSSLKIYRNSSFCIYLYCVSCSSPSTDRSHLFIHFFSMRQKKILRNQEYFTCKWCSQVFIHGQILLGLFLIPRRWYFKNNLFLNTFF